MSSFIQSMDKALQTVVFNRFKGFFGLTDQNADSAFFPRSVVQRKIAEKRGEATVEFISLWRNEISFDWNRQRTAVSREGIMMEYVDKDLKDSIVTVKAVPARMTYDLYFWSKDLDKITQAIESYLFWKQDFPNVVLYYSNLYEMDLYLKFGSVRDITDWNIYEKGLYFVVQMPIEMEGWILSTVHTKTILTIIVNVYMREGSPPNYRDTLLDTFTVTSTT